MDHVFSDFIRANTAVLQHLLDRGHALQEDVFAEILELGTLHDVVVVLILSDCLNLDRMRVSKRKSFLGLHARISEPVHGTLVAADVDAGLGLEVLLAELDKLVVDVLAAEMGVAMGGLDRDNAIIDREKGDIEGATAEVEDQNKPLILSLMFEAVRECGGGRLVDDAEDVKTCDFAGFLGGPTLSIVEVSGDGYDSRRDWLVKVVFDLLLQLDEYVGANLLGGKQLLLALIVDLDHRPVVFASLYREGPELTVLFDIIVIDSAADETFRVINGVFGVACGPRLGFIADENFIIGEGNKGGRCGVAFFVRYDFHLVILEECHARERGTKIDAYSVSYVSHVECVFFNNYKFHADALFINDNRNSAELSGIL